VKVGFGFKCKVLGLGWGNDLGSIIKAMHCVLKNEAWANGCV